MFFFSIFFGFFFRKKWFSLLFFSSVYWTIQPLPCYFPTSITNLNSTDTIKARLEERHRHPLLFFFFLRLFVFGKEWSLCPSLSFFLVSLSVSLQLDERD